MKAQILYRISSVLLLLFAAGHTLGFRKIDPNWGVDSLIGTMRSVRFDAQGFSRTYWDFYVGFGLFVSVFLVFASVLAWQLGGLAPETLALMRGQRRQAELWLGSDRSDLGRIVGKPEIGRLLQGSP